MRMKNTVAYSGNVETTASSDSCCSALISHEGQTLFHCLNYFSKTWLKELFCRRSRKCFVLYCAVLPLIQERNCMFEMNSLLQATFTESIFSKHHHVIHIYSFRWFWYITCTFAVVSLKLQILRVVVLTKFILNNFPLKYEGLSILV
jgi:hypothetical protein